MRVGSANICFVSVSFTSGRAAGGALKGAWIWELQLSSLVRYVTSGNFNDTATNRNVLGQTTNLTEGLNYIDLAGFCTGTSATCTYSNGNTTLEAVIWQ